MNASFKHFPHAEGPLTRLGAALQAAGFSPLEVNNGGAWEPANTWDTAWAEVCSVNEAILVIRHQSKLTQHHTIFLIPGNAGAEIVSDYSAGESAQAVLMAGTIDEWSEAEDKIQFSGFAPPATPEPQPIEGATLTEIEENIRRIRFRTSSFIDQATKLSRALVAAAKASPEAAAAINQVLGTIALTR